MEMTEEQLIRALSCALAKSRPQTAPSVSPRGATRLVLDAAFGGRCPRCGRGAIAVDQRFARCSAGHRFSVTVGTPLQGTKVALTHWITAVWHVHIDLEPCSARSYSRRYGLRHATAWSLMHRVRRALPTITPRLRSAAGLVARRNGAATATTVAACRNEEGLSLVADMELRCPAHGCAPENALVLGRLRAWLTTTFCGVGERYLELYLAEFAARFGRVAAYEQTATIAA